MNATHFSIYYTILSYFTFKELSVNPSCFQLCLRKMYASMQCTSKYVLCCFHNSFTSRQCQYWFQSICDNLKGVLCCYYLSFTWPLNITPHIQLLNCPWIELSFTLSVAIHSVQTDIIIQLELGKSTAWIPAMMKIFDSKKTQALKKLKLEIQYVTPRYFSSLPHLVNFYPGLMPDAGQTWSN